MLAFPGMLVSAALKAGIDVPQNCDDFSDDAFPHFRVFCNIQLCRRMDWNEHWRNAEVIAKISNEDIRELTLGQLVERGISYQQ